MASSAKQAVQNQLMDHARKIGQDLFGEPMPAMQMRHIVIMFAHANWEKLEPLCKSQILRSQIEGYKVMDEWEQRIQNQLEVGK